MTPTKAVETDDGQVSTRGSSPRHRTDAPLVPSPTSRSIRRLVVIDHDPDLRETLGRHLRGAGYVVETAGDADSGVQLITAWRPDFVVLDLGLPGAAGLELLHRLKRDDATSRLPIAILSGEASQGHRDGAWDADADYLLTKPFDVDDLMRVLAAVRLHSDRWPVPEAACHPAEPVPSSVRCS